MRACLRMSKKSSNFAPDLKKQGFETVSYPHISMPLVAVPMDSGGYGVDQQQPLLVRRHGRFHHDARQ